MYFTLLFIDQQLLQHKQHYRKNTRHWIISLRTSFFPFVLKTNKQQQINRAKKSCCHKMRQRVVRDLTTIKQFRFVTHCLGVLYYVDWLRGGRRNQATSGVQRSSEVMPTPHGPRLIKQGSKDSDGSVSSEGSKWVFLWWNKNLPPAC